MERPCGPHAEQHPQEKTWRTSNVLHKRPSFPGEEKETLAFRKDNFTTRQSTQTATLPMEIVSVGLEAPANPSAQTKALAFPVTRTSLIHRAEIQPIDDEDGAGSPVLGRARQWKRCRTSRATPIDMRRDKQRHARPGSAADKDSAENREGLAPAFGRYADVGESKRRVVAGYGGRYGEEERDYAADKLRSHRREGDLPNRQGRAAGENANNKPAGDARAAVEDGESRRQAREERERVDREREQQPAEEANAGNTQTRLEQ